MAEFCMPMLGADMEAGTLVEWKVKVGDPVKRGDVVAVVETDKGAAVAPAQPPPPPPPARESMPHERARASPAARARARELGVDLAAFLTAGDRHLQAPEAL